MAFLGFYANEIRCVKDRIPDVRKSEDKEMNTNQDLKHVFMSTHPTMPKQLSRS